MASLLFPGETIVDEQAALELLVAGFIWVPYMLVSERVKLTFVEGAPVRREVYEPEAGKSDNFSTDRRFDPVQGGDKDILSRSKRLSQ